MANFTRGATISAIFNFKTKTTTDLIAPQPECEGMARPQCAESGRDPSRVRQERTLELTDASRSANTVAEGIPEGFHLAHSERVTAKAQERLAMAMLSSSPCHLQLL